MVERHARFVFLVLCWLVGHIAPFSLACNDGSCSCSVQINVDPASSVPCDAAVRNSTCNSLQAVLSAVAEASGFPGDDCIAVRLFPGTHTVTQSVTITQNLVLWGSTSATTAPPPSPSSSPNDATTTGQLPGTAPDYINNYDAKIVFNSSRDSFDAPFYVLSFVGGAWLSMATLELTGSPGGIEIVNVANIQITNCSFSWFAQGAVDVYNSRSVAMTNCHFFHNGPVGVVKTDEFRGHAAGMSLGYSITADEEENTTAIVENCVFYNNSALAADSSTSEALNDRVFPGRGGGLVVLIDSVAATVTVDVINCSFFNNFATEFGGGAFTELRTPSSSSNHLITFQSCVFEENGSETHAGGLGIEISGNGNGTESSGVVIRDCVFRGNTAECGGGSYVLFTTEEFEKGGSDIMFQRCLFDSNMATEVGAALGVVSYRFFGNKEATVPVQVTDCTFLKHLVSRGGGAVTAAFFPLSFSGLNIFQDNRGPSLVVAGGVLKVSGELRFLGNNLMGLDGGTLYVLSQGQLVVGAGSRILFHGNRGVLGAATVVESLRIPSVFLSLLHNKLCFLRYEDPTLSPLDWHLHNVSLEYRNNMAIVGSAVYIDSVRQCSWESLSSPYFSLSGAFHWPFVTLEDNDNRAHHPNSTDPRWATQTPAFFLDITTTSVSAFAGDDVILGVESRDELGEDTPVIMRLSVDTMGMEQFKFSPSTINYDRLQEKEIRTSFLQLSEGGGDSSDNITVETLLTDFKRDSFSLTSDLCPAGYTLSPHSSLTDFSVCSCDLDHPSILDCDGRKIILEDGLWGFVDKSREGEEGNPLETYPCPPGHCRCQLRSEGSAAQCRFTVDDRNFDDQCVCGREGVLCGSCREGKGVTVLRKICASCHNGFTGLVVGLVVCDAVVMVIMLLLMVPVPGALLPVIFHIQILPYLTEHFPVTFEKVQPFMVYVSSAISLFFPYDFCVSENMSAIVSHSLHYLPLLVALFVTPLVLFLRRVTRHPAPAHGLAWIVFLLFTPLLHTALTSLHCPTIRAAQDTATLKSAVWYLSGDQQCFSGDHIPLGVVSLLVLLLLLATIPTVVLLSRHQIKTSRISSHLLVAPFSHMYRSRWVWWGGVELARRVLVVMFIVAFPGNNYPVYFVLAVLVTVQAYVQPYRRMFWNILELVLSVNVMVLVLIRNTTSIEAALQTYPAGDQGSSSNEGGGGGGGGGGSGGCTDEVDGVTPFVILLSVVYYLPLLLSAVVAVHWLGDSVRSSSIISQLKNALHSPTKQSPELSLSSLEGPRPLRAPTTTTVVDLDQLPLEDSLFSSSLKEGGGGRGGGGDNGERVTRRSTKFYRWGSRTSKSKD